jgi:hypothetical protein
MMKNDQKRISIFKSNGNFIVEISSDLFVHVTKKSFDSEKQLLDYLKEFKSLSDYELEVSEELWSLVINSLNKME